MFEKKLLCARIQRAIAALKEQDIDLWLTVGRETHLLGEPAFLFFLPSEMGHLSALALFKTGENILLTTGLYIEEMQTYGGHEENILYKDWNDFDCKLAELVARVPKNGRIALNFSDGDTSADGLSLTQYRRLQRIFRSAGFEGELVSSHILMKRARAQKSPEEVAGIEHTVLQAMQAFEEARQFIRSGVSGRDIQAWFQNWVDSRRYGYSWEKTGNPYCSIGARSSYYCVRPPVDVFAQPGDLINVDFGLRINGFASDNQRSYYVLRPGETQAPEELQRAFEAVQAAERAAVAAMRPGVDTCVLGQAASDVFERLGYPRVSGLGHELGTFAHEGGIGCGGIGFRTGLDTTLEEGMTFTMEPAILTPYGRLCQEEVVTVTHDGGRMLSTPQKEIWLVK